MDPFIGQIMLCGYTFAPRGWADCAGQLLPIQQNAALYSLLGTTYGGDGRSTFALPDLRGRVAVGPGQRPGGSTYALGQVAGSETATLPAGSLASHGHGMQASGVPSAGQGSSAAVGNSFSTLPSGRGSSGHMYAPGPGTATLAPTVGPAGVGAAHPNIQPYLALRYVIALQGIFPQRP